MITSGMETIMSKGHKNASFLIAKGGQITDKFGVTERLTSVSYTHLTLPTKVNV